MLNSFHGRTMGSLSATGQPKYHAGVEPLLPGFNYAPFGDLAASAKLIDDETCAIMVEPIQGEGGINLPPAGYLEGLRELCDKHKLLLIFDEVQTGMGRTGRWYAHQHWNVRPDIVTLAKALAGGVAMGGLIATPSRRRETEAGHARRHVRRQPARLRSRARHHRDDRKRRAACPGRSDRRPLWRTAECASRNAAPRSRKCVSSGAMIGVELTMDGAGIVQRCIERRLLVNCTHSTVLRCFPL